MSLLSFRSSLVFSLCVFLFAYSALCHSVSLPAKKIAVGYVENQGLGFFSSSADDQIWSFNNNIHNIPEIFYAPDIIKMQCQGTSCVASGNFSNRESSFKPLILSSQDSGESWNLVDTISALPANPGELEISDMSCGGNTCAIVGRVRMSDLLFLFASGDKGQTWKYINKITGMPSDMPLFQLPRVSCQNDTCVIAAVGYDNDTLPLLIVNNLNHQGIEDWTWVKNISGSLPPRAEFYNINSIFCLDNTTCIAGAEYIVPMDASLPKFLITRDSGKSWQIIQEISGVPKGIQSFMDNLYCSNNFCIATGSYTLRNKHGEYPLIMRSGDKGNSWTFVENIHGPVSEGMYMVLSSISCVENTCVITGDYETKNNTLANFLLLSRDGGMSWNQVENIQSFPGLNDFETASVDCAEQSCTAAGMGFYRSGEKSLLLPLILTSYDRGESWQYISQFSGLPPLSWGSLDVVTHVS